MAPKKPEIRKQAATGKTRHITFTVPKTLEIIRKPEMPQASVIMAVYKIALLTICGIIKHKKILPIRT